MKIDNYFDKYLFFTLLYESAGGIEHWLKNGDGRAFVDTIGFWELERLGTPTNVYPYRPEILADKELLPLDALWTRVDTATLPLQELTFAESSALIQFMDEIYGPATVIKFFHALHYAQSLPHAIEIVGLPYSEFEEKWQAWLKQRVE